MTRVAEASEAGVQNAPVSARGRVVVADDHPLFRRGLIEAAQLACPYMTIEEVGRLSELLRVLRDRTDVELVLLDLRLPDCADFAGLRTVRERYPAIPIAIVSALEDPLTINGAIKLGAMGFIPKSARMSVLADAIGQIMAGEVWTPSGASGAMPTAQGRIAEAGLTPAQARIVSGLQRGLLNKQIAFELGLTEHTVKAHMTAAFRKLGVDNRLQAMVLLRGESVPLS